MFKAIFVIVIMSIASLSLAETTDAQTQAYIQSLSSLSYTSNGTAQVPTYVIEASLNNQISPVAMVSMQQHMINDCAKHIISPPPSNRTAYTTWLKIYNEKLCELRKCYESASILGLLPAVSAANSLDNAESQAALNSAISKINSSSCSSGASVDPNLTSQVQ